MVIWLILGFLIIIIFLRKTFKKIIFYNKNNINMVVNNLWIGNIKASKSKSIINDMDIIINLSKDIPFLKKDKLNYRISVNDDLTTNSNNIMYKNLNKFADIIHINLLNQKKILVHCYAGMQRSASLIVAYLMKYFNMSLSDAVIYLKSKRSIVFFPFINFKKALVKFEKKLSKTLHNQKLV